MEAEDSEKVLEQKTDSDVSTQEETTYSYNSTSTSGAVTLKVEWNEPVLGQDTTFHVSATGGSGAYKFRMDAPVIQIQTNMLMNQWRIRVVVNG